jgi:hypothetical protein
VDSATSDTAVSRETAKRQLLNSFTHRLWIVPFSDAGRDRRAIGTMLLDTAIGPESRVAARPGETPTMGHGPFTADPPCLSNLLRGVRFVPGSVVL